MCLVDDGTGTGNKVAKYFIDSDGNYYELYTYVLYSPNGGHPGDVDLHAARDARRAGATSAASPIIPETPNNVNPQDLVAQINKVSNLIYAAFGPSSPGTAAGVPADPGGGRGRAGGADHRTARLQRLHAERRRGQPPARADLADLLGHGGIPDRRIDHDRAGQPEDRQGRPVLRLDLARAGPHAASDAAVG